jgi:hypothetical protein
MKEQLYKSVKNHDKIDVIYNWPQKSYLQNTNAINLKQELGINNKSLILYAGNLGKFQNPYVLVNVLSRLDDSYALVIIGEGTEKNKLINIIEDQNLDNVKFMDKQPLEMMNQIYNQADINFISFSPKIYKTALPSKLPFCLTTDRPIIFTVEEESQISKVLSVDPLTKCINPNNIDSIIEQINQFKSSNFTVDTQNRKLILDRYFSSYNNPLKYKELIIGNLEVKNEK